MTDSKQRPSARRPAPDVRSSGPTGSGPILAVDFGERRIGLAISDEDRRLAVPLETVERSTDRRAVARIRDLAQQRAVSLIVVGEPRRRTETAPERRGDAARRTARFAAKLGEATGLPWILVDETLTSVEARDRIRNAELDTRADEGRVDQIAAQIILEQFLANDSLEGEEREVP